MILILAPGVHSRSIQGGPDDVILGSQVASAAIAADDNHVCDLARIGNNEHLIARGADVLIGTLHVDGRLWLSSINCRSLRTLCGDPQPDPRHVESPAIQSP
jgi:hypothetical protein